MTAPVGFGTIEPLPSPGTLDDRALAALRDLLRACFPQLALLGAWDYRIDSVVSDSEIVCSPVDPSIGLPAAVHVTLTPSILGEVVTPAVGSRVVLEFLDGNQGKPIARGGDPNVAPTLATLLGGTLGAARGDLTAGDAVGFLIPGSGGASWSPTNPGGGIAMHITGSSAKVKIG